MAREKCPPDIPGRVHFCLMFIFVIGSVGTTIVMASSWVQYNHANSIYVPAAAITWTAIDGGCTIESLHSTSTKRTCSGGNMMRRCTEATLYKHNVVAGGRSYIGPFHLTDFSNGTTTSCWYTDDADAEAAWTAADYYCGDKGTCLVFDDPEPKVAWLHPGTLPIAHTVVLVVVLLLCGTMCALPRLTAKFCPGKLGSVGAQYESDSSSDDEPAKTDP